MASSLVLLQLGCAEGGTGAPGTATTATARTTTAPLEEEPVQEEEEACEEEVLPETPPAETLCLSVGRGRFAAAADAALGVGDDERTRPGDATALKVGVDRAGAHTALVRFDLAAIPRGSHVLSAALVLDEVGRGDAKVRAHAVNERWDEAEVRPDARVAFDAEPVAFLDGEARASADLGSLVTAWVDGHRDNDGLLLASDEGMTTFVSSESATDYLRPRLEVCLKPMNNGGDKPPVIEEYGDIVCAVSGPGQDVQACPPDKFLDTWSCVDVAKDVHHCGSCDAGCGKGEVCLHGECLSAVEEQACYGAGNDFCTAEKDGKPVCTDLGDDVANCGACGNACPAAQWCVDGACVCGVGATLCGEVCASLKINNDHCGACGHACAAGETCASGVCLAPSNTFLIGDDNAKWFDVDGASLDLVHPAAYKKSWTHVASTMVAGAVPALMFYSRDSGDAKLVSYAANGTLVTTLGTASNFAEKWDHIVAPRAFNGDYNLLFYSRKDGVLKSLDARADGTFVAHDETVLPSANGEGTTDNYYHPARHSWDNIVPVHIPIGFAATDALFAYSQTSGRGVLFARTLPTARWELVRELDLQKRWDEVAAGDFDADGTDDLAFYDQDTGLLKVAFMTPSWFIKSTASLGDVGTSHGARLVAGQFDGVGGEDFVLYQTDGGERFEKGRFRRWSGQPGGVPSVTLNDGAVRDGWTHLVSVVLGGGAGRPGLLFYSNQHVIDVTYFPMVSPPEGVSPLPPEPTWMWGATPLRGLARHQAALRKTFASAGIAFDVTYNETAKYSAVGANYKCKEEDPDAKSAAKEAMIKWVNDNVDDTVLPVILATEGGGGTGCSGMTSNFVRETYVSDASKQTGYLTEAHSAHEIGHYFGLGHSHVGEDKKTGMTYNTLWIAKLLSGPDADVWTIDTDKAPGGKWQRVWDTPTTFTRALWVNASPQYDQDTLAGNLAIQAARCPSATSSLLPLQFTNGSDEDIEVPLFPPVVSGYSVCPGSERRGFARLSRDQIRAVRHVLYTDRKALIQD